MKTSHLLHALLLGAVLAGPAPILLAQPIITEQPRNQTVAIGGNATFSVVANGVAPLRYQWRSYFNSSAFTNIPFGTESTLVLTNVQSTSRRFGVEVTDGAGRSITSSPLASLTVLLPPPSIVKASSATGKDVGILFSAPMRAAGLEAASNYRVNSGGVDVPIASVVAWPGNTSAVLTLTAPVQGTFTVGARQLIDSAGTPFSASAVATGKVWTSSVKLSQVGVPPAGGGFLSWEEGHVLQRGVGESNDAFNYLHQFRTNDFDVQVQVGSVTKEGNASATGFLSPYNGVATLNVRYTLNPFDPALLLDASPSNGSRLPIWRLWRQVAGNNYEILWGTSIERFPCWLRLRRTGNVFTYFESTNGLAWRQIDDAHHQPGAPAVLMVGLATLSFQDGIFAAGDYQNFGDTRLPENANARITFAPAPTPATVEAGHPATLTGTAVLSGVPNANTTPEYQWQAETSPGSGVFTNVFFATESRWITSPLRPADSGTRCRLIARITGGPEVVSAPIAITVVPDTTPPRVISVTGTPGATSLVVTFSEAIAPRDAADSFNFNSESFELRSATPGDSGRRVTLALDRPFDPAAAPVLTVFEVHDVSGLILEPNPTRLSITTPSAQFARGGARQDLYLAIPGEGLANLRNSPKFPEAPDLTETVSALEGPLYLDDNYGTRISGYLIPPVTGRYNFWMSSDDQGEFWLSTDETPARLSLICHEPSWNALRSYQSLERRNPDAPENRSTTLYPDGLPLTAGQAYYFEALSKEGQGADSLSVAWQLPGGLPPQDGDAPIPGAYLARTIDSGVRIEITQQPSAAPVLLRETGPVRPLWVDRFDADDGGFTAQQTGIPLEPWTYSAAAQAWSTDGIDDVWPSEKLLTSPAMTVSTAGGVRLAFRHRYNFEAPNYDGGRVRIRVNGGEFVPVENSRFRTNGYTTFVDGTGPLYLQPGFGNQSPGYAFGEFITSIADLGTFEPGDRLEIQFQGAWDWSTIASSPNWVIRSMDVTEGLPDPPLASMAIDARAVTDVGRPAPIAYLWQRDCGAGFVDLPGANEAVYRFPAEMSDNCGYRCLVFTPGAAATSQVATVTIALPAVSIVREGQALVLRWTRGILQEAGTPLGPWNDVPQAISPRRLEGPSFSRFFRTIRR